IVAGSVLTLFATGPKLSKPHKASPETWQRVTTPLRTAGRGTSTKALGHCRKEREEATVLQFRQPRLPPQLRHLPLSRPPQIPALRPRPCPPPELGALPVQQHPQNLLLRQNLLDRLPRRRQWAVHC